MLMESCCATLSLANSPTAGDNSAPTCKATRPTWPAGARLPASQQALAAIWSQSAARCQLCLLAIQIGQPASLLQRHLLELAELAELAKLAKLTGKLGRIVVAVVVAQGLRACEQQLAAASATSALAAVEPRTQQSACAGQREPVGRPLRLLACARSG